MMKEKSESYQHLLEMRHRVIAANGGVCVETLSRLSEKKEKTPEKNKRDPR